MKSNGKIQRLKLKNGLIILLEPDTRIHSVAIGFGVNTGGRDESKELDGCSHFLEHMCFRGTQQRNSRELLLAFDRMGAINNAFTSQEITLYWAWVLREQFKPALSLLAEMMRPSLPSGEFETEKKVILEEIAMYNDSPDNRVYIELLKAALGEHPLSTTVLGSADAVRALTRDQMAAYHARRYSANNMVCSISGNFNAGEAKRLIERLCNDWRGGESGRSQPPARVIPGEKFVVKSDLQQQRLGWALGSVCARDPRRHAASLLTHILGGGEGSRLYWAITHKGLAEDIHASYDSASDTGILFVFANVEPRNTRKVIELVARELKSLQHGGVTTAELTRAKNKALTALAISDPAGRMVRQAGHFLATGEIETLEQERRALAAVTRREIAALLRDYPLDCGGTLVGLGPMEKV